MPLKFEDHSLPRFVCVLIVAVSDGRLVFDSADRGFFDEGLLLPQESGVALVVAVGSRVQTAFLHLSARMFTFSFILADTVLL